MAVISFWERLKLLFLRPVQESLQKSFRKSFSDGEGILVFASTDEVIRAERILEKAGFRIEVKGPPPDLQTGCDLVITFPLMRLPEVEKTLASASVFPENILPKAHLLLEPVSIYQVKDLGEWLMVRAANMKITIDRKSAVIVNISGGGCPDVPLLARKLVGKKLGDAPEPTSLGHTLCCYCLQKAYDELKRICNVADSRNSS